MSSPSPPIRIMIALVFAGFTLGAAPSAVPPEVKALYEQKEYQKVIDSLSKLNHDTQAAPEVRRLKVRTLVKLVKPQEALTEYEQLQGGAGQDDVPLLREVALSFILVLVKDMREQMRGAAERNRLGRDDSLLRGRAERRLGTGEDVGRRRLGPNRERPQIEKTAQCPR